MAGKRLGFWGVCLEYSFWGEWKFCLYDFWMVNEIEGATYFRGLRKHFPICGFFGGLELEVDCV